MKQKTLSKLKKILWKHFSLFIRKRDKGICFICGRKCKGSGYHAAHFIPKSIGGLELYFSELNVHGCCYNCNINLGGNSYEYSVKLGPNKIKELYDLKLKTRNVVWSRGDYESKIKLYEKNSKV